MTTSTPATEILTDPEETTKNLARLREPFAPNQIGKLSRYTGPKEGNRNKSSCDVCGGYHAQPSIHLDYVGHAAVTDRLLDVDPFWSWDPFYDDRGYPIIEEDRQGNPTGMWIRLTVCGVTRLGYGTVEPGKTDPVKQLIGDALRNAAMRFGVALDLWHKGDLHGDDGNDGAAVSAYAGKHCTLCGETYADDPDDPETDMVALRQHMIDLHGFARLPDGRVAAPRATQAPVDQPEAPSVPEDGLSPSEAATGPRWREDDPDSMRTYAAGVVSMLSSDKGMPSWKAWNDYRRAVKLGTGSASWPEEELADICRFLEDLVGP